MLDDVRRVLRGVAIRNRTMEPITITDDQERREQEALS
jgi:hypothetical protein